VIAEVNPDGTATVETVAGLLVLHRQGPAGSSYLHADSNTNVTDVTDDSGDVVARFSYTPFGVRTTLYGDPAVAGPLGFCGTLGVRAEAGGLLDMRARLYDPALGRFTSPDPWPAYLPEPATLNWYLYALGDPVSQVDPYGLFCWTGKNKHGKCRGLDDVVDRGREMVRAAAPVLSTVGTVASAAAVVAAGASAVCPPCIPVTGPVAVGLKIVGTAASVVPALAVGATCIGEGVSFDCAVGLASRATMFPVRRLIDQAVPRYVLDEDLAGPIATFGKRLAGLFLKGTTSAGTMLRREK